jgi:hypothetical protein
MGKTLLWIPISGTTRGSFHSARLVLCKVGVVPEKDVYTAPAVFEPAQLVTAGVPQEASVDPCTTGAGSVLERKRRWDICCLVLCLIGPGI